LSAFWKFATGPAGLIALIAAGLCFVVPFLTHLGIQRQVKHKRKIKAGKHLASLRFMHTDVITDTPFTFLFPGLSV